MKIFFSHPSELKPLLHQIKSEIPDFLYAWIDEDSLCWGDTLESEIKYAIKESVDFVVLFLNSTALNSEWVKKEIEWATDREKELDRSFLLTVIVDSKGDLQIPKKIKERVYLSITSFDKDAIKSLSNSISKNLFKLIAKSYGEVRNRSDTGGVKNTFTGKNIIDCHKQIYDQRNHLKNVVNFTSVIKDSKYVLPDTARIGSKKASNEDIESSFLALHPEYISDGIGWADENKIKSILSGLPNSFRIQHGPRMFDFTNSANNSQPIISAALDHLNFHESRAYVSLHNSHKDLTHPNEPTPGLVGIQFLKIDNKLNLVAHFRHIELSFWWVVNVFEMIKILDWAYEKKSHLVNSKGSIIFQASFASWRNQPHAIFNSRLDLVPFGELLEICLKLNNGEQDAASKLAKLLTDKADNTSEYNIDFRGINKIKDILEGINHINKSTTSRNNNLINKLLSEVSKAQEKLKIATNESKIDYIRQNVNIAKGKLKRASKILD